MCSAVRQGPSAPWGRGRPSGVNFRGGAFEIDEIEPTRNEIPSGPSAAARINVDHPTCGGGREELTQAQSNGKYAAVGAWALSPSPPPSLLSKTAGGHPYSRCRRAGHGDRVVAATATSLPTPTSQTTAVGPDSWSLRTGGGGRARRGARLWRALPRSAPTPMPADWAIGALDAQRLRTYPPPVMCFSIPREAMRGKSGVCWAITTYSSLPWPGRGCLGTRTRR